MFLMFLFRIVNEPNVPVICHQQHNTKQLGHARFCPKLPSRPTDTHHYVARVTHMISSMSADRFGSYFLIACGTSHFDYNHFLARMFALLLVCKKKKKKKKIANISQALDE